MYFTYSFIVHFPSLESNLDEGRAVCTDFATQCPQCLGQAKTQYTEEEGVVVKGMQSRANPPRSESQLHHLPIKKP